MSAGGADAPGDRSGRDAERLAVVVAMKPQLRGRVRRNVETLLELGLRVVVVSIRTNKEFFVGLESPLLSARFIETKTWHARYYGWSRRDAVRRQRIRMLRLDIARRNHVRTTLRLRNRPWAMLRHVRNQPTFRVPYGRPVTPFPSWLMVMALVLASPVVALMAVTHAVRVGLRATGHVLRRLVGSTVRWLVRLVPARHRPVVSAWIHQLASQVRAAGRAVGGRVAGLRRRALRAEVRGARAVVRLTRNSLGNPGGAAYRAARERVLARIKVILVASYRINQYFAFWRASEAIVRELNPEIVVSSDLPGLVGASRAARALKVRQVHDCHELYLESTNLKPFERRFLAPIERRHMRRVARVVAVNDSIASEYHQRYGVRPEVVRNCADAPSVFEVRDIRELAGIDAGVQVVLYQGGFAGGRGLDVCVAAVAQMPSTAHLVMLGYGPLQDELDRMAIEHGVQDRVHVVPAVPPDELLAYTASATIGLIPYQPVSKNNYYSLPNKLFEYTSVGLPIVVSDLPELRRVALGAQCGAVYDSYDPASLSEAVTAVLDPRRLHEFQAAAERYGATNTWTTERKILVEAFEYALDRTESVPVQRRALTPVATG